MINERKIQMNTIEIADLKVKVQGEDYIFSPVDIKIYDFNTYDEKRFITYYFDAEGIDQETIKEVREALDRKYGHPEKSISFSIPNANNIITITIS